MASNPLESLAGRLQETLASLPANPIPPDGGAPQILELDDAPDAWNNLLRPYLQTARYFEIHCWQEEQAPICLALQYGSVQQSDWPYGTVITGPVTPEFSDWLLHLSKPDDPAQQTIFFNLFLTGDTWRFESCHYGAELYLIQKNKP